MAIFDVPEAIATYRAEICNDPANYGNLSRHDIVLYYAGTLLYYFVLASPIVSFVFGSYLYISINWFDCHYNEAFSSLRIESYKNFVRLHINKHGDLETYVIGADKMPRKWVRDSQWSAFHAQSR